jgi:hypothetical protein
MESGRKTFSRNETEQFARGLTKTLPVGWSVASTKLGESGIPTADALQLKITLQGPDNAQGFYYGYIVSGRNTFMLFTTSGEPTEPSDFTTFVSTFHLLRPGPYVAPGQVTTAFFFWLAVVGAFFDWRYLRAGGVRPTTRQKMGFGIALACCISLLLWLALRGRSADVIGELTAMLLSPLFFFWEVARWRTRRLHPLVRFGHVP